jgi:hypothetical protein
MLILKLSNKDVQVKSMEVQVTIYDLQALVEILSFVTKEIMTNYPKWLSMTTIIYNNFIIYVE